VITSDFLGGALVLLVTIAVVIGLPLVISDWLRQRRAAKEQAGYLAAWQQAQDKVQQAHAADQTRWGQLQERSLALTEQGQAQARQVNERFIELHTRRVELAEKLVNEQQRTNALLEHLLARLGPRNEADE
jgi:membrane protein involved in colicin uptake